MHKYISLQLYALYVEETRCLAKERDTQVPCIWVFLQDNVVSPWSKMETSLLSLRCQDVENDIVSALNHFIFLMFTGPLNRKQLWVLRKFIKIEFWNDINVSDKRWVDDRNISLEIFNLNLKDLFVIVEVNTHRHILGSTIEILNADVTNHKTSFTFYYKDLYSKEEHISTLLLFYD